MIVTLSSPTSGRVEVEGCDSTRPGRVEVEVAVEVEVGQHVESAVVGHGFGQGGAVEVAVGGHGFGQGGAVEVAVGGHGFDQDGPGRRLPFPPPATPPWSAATVAVPIRPRPGSDHGHGRGPVTVAVGAPQKRRLSRFPYQ